MEGKGIKDKKTATPAPGAEGSADQEQKNKETTIVVIPEDAPEWVKALFHSNQLVIISNQELIASNQDVLTGIEAFKEKGGDFIKNVIDETRKLTINNSSDATLEVKPLEVVDFNPEAKYVVSKGKKFQDAEDSKVIYQGNDNVTHIGEERLKNLLSQGIIEEFVEPDFDDSDEH